MGLRPDEFWDLTPYEFERLISGWEKKERWRKEEIAWQTVLVVNCCGHLKKPISIDDILPTECPGQAPEEHLNITKELNEMARGEIRGQVKESLTDEEVWERIREMRQ